MSAETRGGPGEGDLDTSEGTGQGTGDAPDPVGSQEEQIANAAQAYYRNEAPTLEKVGEKWGQGGEGDSKVDTEIGPGEKGAGNTEDSSPKPGVGPLYDPTPTSPPNDAEPPAPQPAPQEVAATKAGTPVEPTGQPELPAPAVGGIQGAAPDEDSLPPTPPEESQSREAPPDFEVQGTLEPETYTPPPEIPEEFQDQIEPLIRAIRETGTPDGFRQALEALFLEQTRILGTRPNLELLAQLNEALGVILQRYVATLPEIYQEIFVRTNSPEGRAAILRKQQEKGPQTEVQAKEPEQPAEPEPRPIPDQYTETFEPLVEELERAETAEEFQRALESIYIEEIRAGVEPANIVTGATNQDRPQDLLARAISKRVYACFQEYPQFLEIPSYITRYRMEDLIEQAGGLPVPEAEDEDEAEAIDPDNFPENIRTIISEREDLQELLRIANLLIELGPETEERSAFETTAHEYFRQLRALRSAVPAQGQSPRDILTATTSIDQALTDTQTGEQREIMTRAYSEVYNESKPGPETGTTPKEGIDISDLSPEDREFLARREDLDNLIRIANGLIFTNQENLESFREQAFAYFRQMRELRPAETEEDIQAFGRVNSLINNAVEDSLTDEQRQIMEQVRDIVKEEPVQEVKTGTPPSDREHTVQVEDLSPEAQELIAKSEALKEVVLQTNVVITTSLDGDLDAFRVAARHFIEAGHRAEEETADEEAEIINEIARALNDAIEAVISEDEREILMQEAASVPEVAQGLVDSAKETVKANLEASNQLVDEQLKLMQLQDKLQDDPENTELQEAIRDQEEVIALVEGIIAVTDQNLDMLETAGVDIGEVTDEYWAEVIAQREAEGSHQAAGTGAGTQPGTATQPRAEDTTTAAQQPPRIDLGGIPAELIPAYEELGRVIERLEQAQAELVRREAELAEIDALVEGAPVPEPGEPAENPEAEAEEAAALARENAQRLREQIQVEEKEPVKGWKKFARGVVEFVTNIAGAWGVKTIVTGAIAALAAGTVLATGGGALLVATLAGVAGGLLGGVINSKVHHLFHPGEHVTWAENCVVSKFLGGILSFKNRLRNRLIDIFQIPQRMGDLATVYHAVRDIDLAQNPNLTLQNIEGLTDQQLLTAYRQLIVLRRTTEFRALNAIELENGFTNAEGNAVQNMEAINHLIQVIPEIISANNIDTAEITQAANAEITEAVAQARRAEMLNKMFKGAVVGGIFGAVSKVVQNLISTGDFLGRIRGETFAGVPKFEDALQDIEAVQQDYHQIQVDILKDNGVDQRVINRIFETIDDGDGVLRGEELAKVQALLGDDVIKTVTERTGEVVKVPSTGFSSYDELHLDNWDNPDLMKELDWGYGGKIHGLNVGTGEPGQFGGGMAIEDTFEKLHDAGVTLESLNQADGDGARAFNAILTGQMSVEDAIANPAFDLEVAGEVTKTAGTMTVEAFNNTMFGLAQEGYNCSTELDALAQAMAEAQREAALIAAQRSFLLASSQGSGNFYAALMRTGNNIVKGAFAATAAVAGQAVYAPDDTKDGDGRTQGRVGTRARAVARAARGDFDQQVRGQAEEREGEARPGIGQRAREAAREAGTRVRNAGRALAGRAVVEETAEPGAPVVPVIPLGAVGNATMARVATHAGQRATRFTEGEGDDEQTGFGFRTRRQAARFAQRLVEAGIVELDNPETLVQDSGNPAEGLDRAARREHNDRRYRVMFRRGEATVEPEEPAEPAPPAEPAAPRPQAGGTRTRRPGATAEMTQDLRDRIANLQTQIDEGREQAGRATAQLREQAARAARARTTGAGTVPVGETMRRVGRQPLTTAPVRPTTGTREPAGTEPATRPPARPAAPVPTATTTPQPTTTAAARETAQREAPTAQRPEHPLEAQIRASLREFNEKQTRWPDRGYTIGRDRRTSEGEIVGFRSAEAAQAFETYLREKGVIEEGAQTRVEDMGEPDKREVPDPATREKTRQRRYRLVVEEVATAEEPGTETAERELPNPNLPRIVVTENKEWRERFTKGDIRETIESYNGNIARGNYNGENLAGGGFQTREDAVRFAQHLVDTGAAEGEPSDWVNDLGPNVGDERVRYQVLYMKVISGERPTRPVVSEVTKREIPEYREEKQPKAEAEEKQEIPEDLFPEGEALLKAIENAETEEEAEAAYTAFYREYIPLSKRLDYNDADTLNAITELRLEFVHEKHPEFRKIGIRVYREVDTEFRTTFNGSPLDADENRSEAQAAPEEPPAEPSEPEAPPEEASPFDVAPEATQAV
ncbi:hypothetical protein JW710_00195 [Candidatus Dojkabacteria bacterium]|nr:hypothetical protein [Candidatus Dojkabacteria bacterium]